MNFIFQQQKLSFRGLENYSNALNLHLPMTIKYCTSWTSNHPG